MKIPFFLFYDQKNLVFANDDQLDALESHGGFISVDATHNTSGS
jgi:hypothetical protein